MDPTHVTFDNFIRRVHEDDRQGILDAVDCLLNGRAVVEQDYRAVRSNGELRYFTSNARADRDERGKVLRIIGTDRDITDQIRKEDSLKRALDEVAELRDRLELENMRLREEVLTITGFDQIVGQSEALRRCLNLVSKAAPTDAAIMILGETGTGKGLVAKSIHELSRRRQQRMVSLNCSALPAELVESELFGHERGAFTGAHQLRKGRFEIADGGTLFLDEIGDLALPLQGKLLRAIQDGEFERVGGSETIRVNVRLIAATNQDLDAAIVEGRFRADLLYRINTVTIRMPPLRERKDDIPALAQHFLAKHGARLNKRVDSISAAEESE